MTERRVRKPKRQRHRSKGSLKPRGRTMTKNSRTMRNTKANRKNSLKVVKVDALYALLDFLLRKLIQIR